MQIPCFDFQCCHGILMAKKLYEPPHDKTNNVAVRLAKTQISLGIRPVWSQSSLCAQWVAKDSYFKLPSCGQRRLWSDWADAQADLSLRWAHSHFVGFVTMRLILSFIAVHSGEQLWPMGLKLSFRKIFSFAERMNGKTCCASSLKNIASFCLWKVKIIALHICGKYGLFIIIAVVQRIQRLQHLNATRIWAATWQNQQSDCAPSEDSDQPGHPPSLIRVFACA